MIEIVHFQNRWGKPMVAVLNEDHQRVPATPMGKEYAERYAAGLYKPFYPVPVKYDFVRKLSFPQQCWVYAIRTIWMA